MLQLQKGKLKELKRKKTKYQKTSTWHQHIDLLESLFTIYDYGYGDDASGNDDYAETYIKTTSVIMMIMQEPTLKRWWW